MIVRLWEHAGTGLIVSYPTGVVYSNQVGGHACYQQELEGFFVPVANDCGLAPNGSLRSPETELFAYFSQNPTFGEFTEKDAAAVESAFANFPIWSGIKVDREKLDQSHEAWVYVNVTFASLPGGLIEGLSDTFDAILTWTNTD